MEKTEGNVVKLSDVKKRKSPVVHTPTHTANNHTSTNEGIKLSNMLLGYEGAIRCLLDGVYYYGIVQHSRKDHANNTVILVAINASREYFEVDFPIKHLLKLSKGEESDFVKKEGRLYLPLSCLVGTRY